MNKEQKEGPRGIEGIKGLKLITKEEWDKRFNSTTNENVGMDTDILNTLVEQAKLALGRDEVAKATIMELYTRYSCLLQYLPFENIAGNCIAFNRGTDRVTEMLYLGGGDLDTDAKYSIKDRSENNVKQIKKQAQKLTRIIIKGDSKKNVHEFDGIQVRCDYEGQVIDNSQFAEGDVLKLSNIS